MIVFQVVQTGALAGVNFCVRVIVGSIGGFVGVVEMLLHVML